MRTYRTAAMLWASALAGLVLALVGDGVADVVATLLLVAPLLVVASMLVRSRR